MVKIRGDVQVITNVLTGIDWVFEIDAAVTALLQGADHYTNAVGAVEREAAAVRALVEARGVRIANMRAAAEERRALLERLDYIDSPMP